MTIIVLMTSLLVELYFLICWYWKVCSDWNAVSFSEGNCVCRRHGRQWLIHHWLSRQPMWMQSAGYRCEQDAPCVVILQRFTQCSGRLTTGIWLQCWFFIVGVYLTCCADDELDSCGHIWLSIFMSSKTAGIFTLERKYSCSHHPCLGHNFYANKTWWLLESWSWMLFKTLGLW